MVIGVPKESFPGERRVAIVPLVIPTLKNAGFEVVIESGAGVAAGYPDADYIAKGARIAPDRSSAFHTDLVLQILCHGSNDRTGKADLPLLRRGQVLIGFLRPLGSLETVQEIASTGVTAFSLELMPRTTIAQSMDVLSSMATLCGYHAVVLAAEVLPRMFPMLTTAAGTITPARVFVIGAGVAGLQAIATARRLGAVVSAFDVRPAVQEQVESLGAKFLRLEITEQAEGSGGYAKELSEETHRRELAFIAQHLKDTDVVITTAAIPGKRAPLLITAGAVGGMKPGSVIVDLAAETGGNCELTKLGRDVVRNGVLILGPANLPSTVPYHASQMYARNVSSFLLHVTRDGTLVLDFDDEITRDTCVTHAGEVRKP